MINWQKRPMTEGVWKFPNGEGYYAYILRHYTTTTLSADEIHALGLEQLERIHAEMRVIFDHWVIHKRLICRLYSRKSPG
jgi:uncharacterized protein (DUF885 family)